MRITEGGTNQAQSGLEDEQSSMRLDLDISTEEKLKDELPNSKLTSLFKELFELGKEISSQGDRP